MNQTERRWLEAETALMEGSLRSFHQAARHILLQRHVESGVYLSKICREQRSSVQEAEMLTAALHRERRLSPDLRVRFRPLHTDFDIVPNRWIEGGCEGPCPYYKKIDSMESLDAVLAEVERAYTTHPRLTYYFTIAGIPISELEPPDRPRTNQLLPRHVDSINYGLRQSGELFHRHLEYEEGPHAGAIAAKILHSELFVREVHGGVFGGLDLELREALTDEEASALRGHISSILEGFTEAFEHNDFFLCNGVEDGVITSENWHLSFRPHDAQLYRMDDLDNEFHEAYEREPLYGEFSGMVM